MERNDDHTIHKKHRPKLKAFWQSYRSKLLILGIFLLLYDIAFLFLYFANTRSFQKNIEEIMQMQQEFHEGISNLKGLQFSLVTETEESEEQSTYWEERERLLDFVEFLKKEDLGVYCHGLASMCEKYLEISDAARNDYQEDEVSFYMQADRIQKLAISYSDYADGELQELMQLRLDELYKTMQQRLIILIISFLIVTAAVIFFVVRMTGYLLSPVNHMMNLVNHTSLNEWPETEEQRNYLEPASSAAAGRKDEMGRLLQAFLDMREKLYQQYRDLLHNQEVELRLKEEQEKHLIARSRLATTQLKVFQARINSHFLFNSLNIVSRLAYLEEAPKTKEAAGLLASFLRSALNQFNRVVNLSEEFESVRQYVRIQDLRFGERVRVDIELDPDIEGFRVPSMILQPLLENAYVHGLSGTMSGYIRCTGELEEKGIVLAVWDDGGTMTAQRENELLTLLRQSDENNTSQIGISNVWQRLRLNFGDRIELILEYETGTYTKIGFRFFDILHSDGETHRENNEETGQERMDLSK